MIIVYHYHAFEDKRLCEPQCRSWFVFIRLQSPARGTRSSGKLLWPQTCWKTLSSCVRSKLLTKIGSCVHTWWKIRLYLVSWACVQPYLILGNQPSRLQVTPCTPVFWRLCQASLTSTLVSPTTFKAFQTEVGNLKLFDALFTFWRSFRPFLSVAFKDRSQSLALGSPCKNPLSRN